MSEILAIFQLEETFYDVGISVYEKQIFCTTTATPTKATHATVISQILDLTGRIPPCRRLVLALPSRKPPRRRLVCTLVWVALSSSLSLCVCCSLSGLPGNVETMFKTRRLVKEKYIHQRIPSKKNNKMNPRNITIKHAPVFYQNKRQTKLKKLALLWLMIQHMTASKILRNITK